MLRDGTIKEKIMEKILTLEAMIFKGKIAASIIMLFIVGAAYVLTADVNISIPTNATQDVKLARVLDYLNQDREVPYTTIDDALKDRMIRDTRQLIREMDEREHKAIFEAWETADEATKEQIRKLLGVR